jgi:protein-S-isoprenylcysteine O-methyltransferase Ste14
MKLFQILYFSIIAGYGLTEMAILVTNGTFFSRKKRDPTAKLVVVPFMLAIAGAPVELNFRHGVSVPLIAITGAVLALTGAIVRIKALLDLGAAFSMKVEIRAGQELVTRGLYAKIRHPLYLASILLAFGAPLLLNAWLCLGFSLLTVLGIFLRIRREELELRATLPGYENYCVETWRLIPGLF